MELDNEKNIKENIKEQLWRLEQMCRLYDNGEIFLANYMTIILRLLFHRSTGLCVKDLGKALKSKDFINSATEDKQNFFYNLVNVDGTGKDTRRRNDSYQGLVLKVSNKDTNKFRYEPKCHRQKNKPDYPKINFNTWWSKEIVVKHPKVGRLTREKITFNLANKDGVAHIDEEIPSEYISFKNENINDFYMDNKQAENENSPLLPTIRQIAYEVLESLNPVYRPDVEPGE